MKVGIEEIVADYPEEILTPEDRSYLFDFLPPALKGVYRLPKEMRVLRDVDAAEIMTERVVKKLFDTTKIKPSDIDYIIANNCGGTLVVPMIGCYIHHRFGFPVEVPALNISQACASFVDACEIAWNLILAGKYKKILVVVVSVWETQGGQGRRDLTDPMSAVMGDVAAAAVISAENLKCEFLSYYNRTWGEAYPMSGADPRRCAHPELPQAKEQPEMSNYMWGSPQFFVWWKKVGPNFALDGFKGAVKLAGLTLNDIQLVIFHQPVDMLYDVWMEGAEKGGVPKHIWKHTWDKYGNMSNALVPCNLVEFWENGDLKKDMIMAWITIGAGAHVPTMIVKWLV